MIVACRCGDAEQVERCLAQGADLDQGDGDGCTALMHAAKLANVDMVRCLLSAGADPKRVDICGRTALMWATWRNPPECAASDCIDLLWNCSDALAVCEKGLDVIGHAHMNANEKVVAVIESLRIQESVSESGKRSSSSVPRI